LLLPPYFQEAIAADDESIRVPLPSGAFVGRVAMWWICYTRTRLFRKGCECILRTPVLRGLRAWNLLSSRGTARSNGTRKPC
jgi:hypothetical protein